MKPTGYGIFINKLGSALLGDITHIPEYSREKMGCRWIAVEAADGLQTQNVRTKGLKKLDDIDKLIEYNGSTEIYIYNTLDGADPYTEAKRMAKRYLDLNPHGTMVRITRVFTEKRQPFQLIGYVIELKKILLQAGKKVDVGVFYDADCIWKTMDNRFDYTMSVVKIGKTPFVDVRSEFLRLDESAIGKPYSPAVQIFEEPGYTVTPTKLLALADSLNSTDIPACGFWLWDAKGHPSVDQTAVEQILRKMKWQKKPNVIAPPAEEVLPPVTPIIEPSDAEKLQILWKDYLFRKA